MNVKRVCFECGVKGLLHDHHVVPRVLGGTRTVLLCESCHGKIHDKAMNISRLTCVALDRLRKQNRRISSKIPFGYRLALDGRTLNPNTKEQAAINRIIFRRKRGMSLAKIAISMEGEKIKTCGGGRWYPSTVAAILKRQRKLVI